MISHSSKWGSKSSLQLYWGRKQESRNKPFETCRCCNVSVTMTLNQRPTNCRDTKDSDAQRDYLWQLTLSLKLEWRGQQLANDWTSGCILFLRSFLRLNLWSHPSLTAPLVLNRISAQGWAAHSLASLRIHQGQPHASNRWNLLPIQFVKW